MTLAQFQGSMPNSLGAGVRRWGSWEVIGPEGGALVEGVNPISAGRLWEVCQPDSAHPPDTKSGLNLDVPASRTGGKEPLLCVVLRHSQSRIRSHLLQSPPSDPQQ